jgi:hypothetical protein
LIRPEIGVLGDRLGLFFRKVLIFERKVAHFTLLVTASDGR